LGQEVFPAPGQQPALAGPGPLRRAAQESGRLYPTALPDQRCQAGGQVKPISAEDFVGALPVEHYLDSCLAGEPEDPVLRVDPRAAERFILAVDQGIEVCEKLFGYGPDLVRHGPGGLCHEIDPALLADRRIVGHVAEGVQVQVLAAEFPHGQDDGRRVDAARQSSAHRHVAAEVQPHVLEEKLAGPPGGLLKRDVRPGRQINVPVADRFRRVEPVQRDLQVVGGWNLSHAFQKRLAAVIGVAVAEILIEPLRVDPPWPTGKFKQDLQLGGEREPPVDFHIVERLDAEEITGEQEAALLRVQNGKREHAHQSGQGRSAPPGTGSQQHLRVRAGVERVPESFELLAKLEVVVDLAVEDDVVAPVRAGHRLSAGLRQVDDGEPPVRQRRLGIRQVVSPVPGQPHAAAGVQQVPVVVRAAVRQLLQRERDERAIHAIGGGHEHPGDPTHAPLEPS